MTGGRSGKIEGVVYPPPEVLERYAAAGILGCETVASALRDTAKRVPDRTALVSPEGRFTYQELDDISDRVAAGFLKLGLLPLDRVIFQVGNVPEIIFGLYGCFKAGLIPVCTLPTHRESEITYLANLTQARGYLCQARFRNTDLIELSQAIAPECPSVVHWIAIGAQATPPRFKTFDDVIAFGSTEEAQDLLRGINLDPMEVCIFQVSGGTTGMPKVIPRMNSEYVYNMRCVAGRAGFSERTVMLWPLPAIHNAAVGFYNTPTHLKGGTVILQQAHDPDALLATVERERVTFFATVKPLAVRIAESGRHRSYDLSSIESTSSTNCAAFIQENLGLRSFQQFGMSEGMGMRTAPDDPEHLQRASIGRPLSPYDEVRLLEPGTEREVPIGEIGEFCARGPYTFRGYYKADDLNREAFTTDGFYRSGDLMRAHAVDGKIYYSFEGRIKDSIDRGSEKISGEEVERALQTCPSVDHAAVIGVPDREYGERVCACLVVKPGQAAPTVAALGDHLSGQKLAKFKWPERVEYFDTFPLTEIGKVDKKRLRLVVEERMRNGDCGGTN